jgi:predicted nucleotidyltransferase
MESLLTQFFASPDRPDVLAAYLFGSHARGAAHSGSDVDVAILFDRQLLPSGRDRATRAQALASELIDATHCNAIDVVVLNDAPAELAVNVLDLGIALCDAQMRRSADNLETVRTFERDARLRFGDIQPFLAHMRKLKLEALAR